MAKFFLTTDDGNQICPNNEGSILPSVHAAISEARTALADMARDHPPNGARLKALVEDEARNEVYRASLKFTETCSA